MDIPIPKTDLTWVNMDRPNNLMYVHGVMWFSERPDWNAVELSRTMAGFVDEAGKDAPSRRERMNQLIEFSVEFYRQLMRDFSGMPVEGDEILQRAVAAAHRDWPGNAESAAACLDASVGWMTSFRRFSTISLSAASVSSLLTGMRIS